MGRPDGPISLWRRQQVSAQMLPCVHIFCRIGFERVDEESLYRREMVGHEVLGYEWWWYGAALWSIDSSYPLAYDHNFAKQRRFRLLGRHITWSSQVERSVLRGAFLDTDPNKPDKNKKKKKLWGALVARPTKDWKEAIKGHHRERMQQTTGKCI